MDYNDPFIEITSRLDKSRKKVSHKPTIPKPFVTITYPAGHPSVAMGFEVETLRHSVFCYEHTLPETNSKFALESHGWLSGRLPVWEQFWPIFHLCLLLVLGRGNAKTAI